MDIVLTKLTKEFHDGRNLLKVIESLDFSFRGGAKVGVLGRSGVGKSTLLHLIGGLERPSSGSVQIGELDLSHLTETELSKFRLENVGVIFQQANLLPDFSALENVMTPLLLANREPQEANNRASAMLEKLGLANRLDHFPSQLSGGEQQRVAIARALVNEPKLILADEPTGNLDESTAKLIFESLIEAVSDIRGTLVLVTHDSNLVSGLDIRVEMKSGGELIVLL